MARTRAASQRTRAKLARVANLFWVASRTNAVEFLFTLTEGERHVSDLAKATRMSHSSSSKILVKLRLAGLVARRRDAQHAVYSLTDRGREVLTVAKLATRRG
jgi:DNA-binding MarR family transcriptional regulator